MATASQLFSNRDTAGAAYSAALAALATAWTNLRALDLACTNARVLNAHQSELPVYTFPNTSQWQPECLVHPVYAAAPVYPCTWHAAALATANDYIANLS